MADHIVRAYDVELETLGRNIAEMGGIAEYMVSRAVDSLDAFDADLAGKVVTTDPRLDALQREVEERAIMMLARRQPLAVDLREVVVAIRISSDLERIGDLASSIAKRSALIADEARLPRAIIGLRHMGETASLQLKDVLDAYAQRDVIRAKSVWQRDADLDALEDVVFRDLLTTMMEEPRNITFCAHLLFCSKNLERIGDHATNIAEDVHYLVTGESLPSDRPKGRAGRTTPVDAPAAEAVPT